MNCNPHVTACFERTVNHGYAVEFHVLALVVGAVAGLIVQAVLALAPIALIFLVLYANVAPWGRHWAHKWRRLVLLTWNGQGEMP